MTRHWYLIDNDGCRRIDVSEKSWDFWSDFRAGDAQGAAWPAFTQAAVCAELGKTVTSIERLAGEHELDCRDVTDAPELWDGGLCLASDDDLTLMTEPSVDFDERFLGPDAVEQILEHLAVDGAFFGHDPTTGTLTLTIFSNGTPDFTWSDSIEPGPSHAVTFHDDGTATSEDPRKFALRRLGQPESSPFLDRYAFIEHELAKLGLVDVQPDLANRPIVAVLHLGAEPSRNLG
jgi:hypothetical protein